MSLSISSNVLQRKRGGPSPSLKGLSPAGCVAGVSESGRPSSVEVPPSPRRLAVYQTPVVGRDLALTEWLALRVPEFDMPYARIDAVGAISGDMTLYPREFDPSEILAVAVPSWDDLFVELVGWTLRIRGLRSEWLRGPDLRILKIRAGGL